MLLTKKPILRGRRLAYALALGFFMVCLVQVASLAVLLIGQTNQERAWREMQSRIYPALAMQESMQNLFLEARVTWRSYLLTGDPELRRKFERHYERLATQLTSAQNSLPSISSSIATSVEELRAAIEQYYKDVLGPGLAMTVPLAAADFQQVSEASVWRATLVNHAFFRLKDELQKVYTELSNHVDNWMQLKVASIGSLVVVALVITGYVGWLSLRTVRFFRRAEEERRTAVRQGQFFKAVLDQLPAGVSVRSAPSGETVMVNRAARQIMGEARIPQSVTQVTTEGVMHPDGTPYKANELPMMRALTKGESVSGEEMLFERTAGGSAAVLCSSTPVIDENRQTIAAITIFQDISDRKKLESNLEAKTRELDRLVREQQRQIEWLKRLQEITAKVSAQTSVSDICRDVLPAIATMLEAGKCCVCLADATPTKLQALAPAFGISEEQIHSMPDIPVVADDSPLMRMFWEDATIIFNDLQNNTAAARYQSFLQPIAAQSVAMVRLAARGRPVGALAIFDHREKRPFDMQDVQIMRILAGPLAIAFDNARLYESLRERNEQLTTLLQEAHHRIKNNLAMITSLLSLEMSYGLDKSAEEVCSSAIGRIESIARVHALLTRDSTHGVPLQPLIEQLVQSLTATCLSPIQRINIECNVASLHLPSREATALALVTSELLSNALRHGFAGRDRGSLTITLRQQSPTQATLEVINDGVALPSETPQARHGLGLRIVQTLAQRDLQGDFHIALNEGKTVATVRFHLPSKLTDSGITLKTN